MFAPSPPNPSALSDPPARSVHSNLNRLQFFSSLFTSNEITYLDPHKTFCIIQTERYQQIKEQLNLSLTHQQALEKKAYQLNLDNIGLGKELNVYREEIEKIGRNYQAVAAEYEKAVERNRENERAIQELRQQSRRSQRQDRPAEWQSKRNQPREEKSVQNTSCQTVALQELQEIAAPVEAKEDAPSKPQIEEAQHRLYELLQAEMLKFQQQFQEKLCSLEQSKHNIEKWQAENLHLRAENSQLRQKIIDRDIEEQKLKIWRESIFGFVSRVESQIAQPPRKRPHLIPEETCSEEVQRLREEVLELRGRVVEMRGKVRRIDEMMEGEGEVNDDGAIGLLVRLSQKVKAIVKGMIMEVEQI